MSLSQLGQPSLTASPAGLMMTANANDSALQALRGQYPARPAVDSWERTALATEDVLHLVAEATSTANNYSGQHQRRGTDRLLRWLSSFPGDTWQQRWNSSLAEHDAQWRESAGRWLAEQSVGTVARNPVELASGFLVLMSLDVLRPSLAHLLQRRNNAVFLTREMSRVRDPEGFALLRDAVAATPALQAEGSAAIAMIAKIVAAKGGTVVEVSVGDLVQAYDLRRTAGKRATYMSAAYALLRQVGVLPAHAPATFRALANTTGQRSLEALLDRYAITCEPVRAVLLDYLRERQPSVDYSTLDQLAFMLGGKFWADLERHHPGIDSLHLAPEVAAAWKERRQYRIRKVKHADGTTTEERIRRLSDNELTTVRAFYQDIAQWALEEPSRWGPWVAPCPVRDSDLTIRQSKVNKHRKARMDQRTRERLPVLPLLVKTAQDQLELASRRLRAAQSVDPGQDFDIDGRRWHRPVLARNLRMTPLVWAVDPDTGKRRDLAAEEAAAFWAWAILETLRHTGIRVEELLELAHHAITEYRLPSTGELVPLLQIAPSKSDAERLLLISPELADVLSAVLQRVRGADGMVPMVAAYDRHERTWSPPMPLLFQRRTGSEIRGIPASTVKQLLNKLLDATGLTDATGQPLRFTPHDFRRIFITDAIMNGLPPHIAQIIAGHENVETTMGYKAAYPEEAIESYRAFIARRRSQRPSAEYRTPTDTEWDEFLAHFEKRKLSIGICARAFSTPCIHEHACVRCSLLRPDPQQRARLEEIRDNLTDRISEAEREGWLGEIEGLQVSLAGAEAKLAQLDEEATRQTIIISLGMPTFTEIATSTTSSER
ncbi:tyrosine-type recombinase/integrase [Nocardia sp. NPDC051570]|uniref:tyrosine-type recombinase/integrase n=1 Tax=Nocardia sp. NPDC051570 TaxID=3364324 RepID=UPI0037A9955F